MSKLKSKKNIILSHALMEFNDRGIEYVGMREIASNLNMRVGNITYYFPTKDDLVAELAMELATLNSQTIKYVDGLNMVSFLEMYRSVFENHYQYRCLFISFVHLMQQNKKIALQYHETQKLRFNTLKKNMNELIENKEIKSTLNQEKIDYIISSISLTARFWLSEATISNAKKSKKQLFAHYLSLIAHFLEPYSTKKGQVQIEQFLKQL